VDGFSFAVSEDLNLDMVTRGIVTFYEHSRVLEKCLASRLDHLEAFLDLFGVVARHETHSTATAGC
jgi:hypothetical protein